MVKSKKSDTATAKSLGISVVDYRILRSLDKGPREGLTYREIEKETGYYSILTAALRAESSRGTPHENSLESRGLVKVRVYEDDFLRFAITAKGRKAIT